jgi:hypothetical protein
MVSAAALVVNRAPTAPVTAAATNPFRHERRVRELVMILRKVRPERWLCIMSPCPSSTLPRVAATVESV